MPPATVFSPAELARALSYAVGETSLDARLLEQGDVVGFLREASQHAHELVAGLGRIDARGRVLATLPLVCPPDLLAGLTGVFAPFLRDADHRVRSMATDGLFAMECRWAPDDDTGMTAHIRACVHALDMFVRHPTKDAHEAFAQEVEAIVRLDALVAGAASWRCNDAAPWVAARELTLLVADDRLAIRKVVEALCAHMSPLYATHPALAPQLARTMLCAIDELPRVDDAHIRSALLCLAALPESVRAVRPASTTIRDALGGGARLATSALVCLEGGGPQLLRRFQEALGALAEAREHHDLTNRLRALVLYASIPGRERALGAMTARAVADNDDPVFLVTALSSVPRLVLPNNACRRKVFGHEDAAVRTAALGTLRFLSFAQRSDLNGLLWEPALFDATAVRAALFCPPDPETEAPSRKRRAAYGVVRSYKSLHVHGAA